MCVGFDLICLVHDVKFPKELFDVMDWARSELASESSPLLWHNSSLPQVGMHSEAVQAGNTWVIIAVGCCVCVLLEHLESSNLYIQTTKQLKNL